MTASVTVDGHTLNKSTTVAWVKPLDCSQPWPRKIGYINALDCTVRTAAGSALAKDIFEGVSCALSVASFFVPGGDEAEVFAHAPEDTAIGQLVVHLKDLQIVAGGSKAFKAKAFFMELVNAGSVPSFLHDIVNLVQTMSANGLSAAEAVESIAADITDLAGLTPCVDVLEKIVGAIVSATPSGPSVPYQTARLYWAESASTAGWLSQDLKAKAGQLLSHAPTRLRSEYRDAAADLAELAIELATQPWG